MTQKIKAEGRGMQIAIVVIMLFSGLLLTAWSVVAKLGGFALIG